MDKNSTQPINEKEEKAKIEPRSYIKKCRRIKRRPFTRRKPLIESQR